MPFLKTKNQRILFVAVSLLIIVYIVFTLLKNNLIKHHLVTTAKVTDCYWASRGTARYVVEAEFTVNGETIKTSFPLSYQDFKLDSLKAHLINKLFPVVYNPTHPNLNYLLMEKQNFELYNVSIPDNLSELIGYLHGYN